MDHVCRTEYDGAQDLFSLASGLSCDPEEGRTIQSEKDDADINVIVKRFGLTGELPSNVRAPLNVDFTELFSFQDAMNAIRSAQESFDAMPADVRSRFENDPAKFVDFCSDEKNLDEMRKLGLAVPAKPVEAPVAPPVKP